MSGLNRQERRRQEQARRRLKLGNSLDLAEVPPSEWPVVVRPPAGLQRLLRGERFLVFDCADPAGVRLLMIQRLDGQPGITWDELYGCKEAAGYGDREAVEIYPEASRLVNVANVRHLWVLPAGQRMAFGLDTERERGRKAL